MATEVQATNPLMDIIEFNGKKYITSKRFHEEYKPTRRVSDTNQSIRSMPAYTNLVESGHIVDVTREYADSDASGVLPLVVKSNAYNPVMLIDPVAQKEIEHHFQVSVSQAVQSSRENAVLGVAGINLELIAQDPHTLLLLQTLSKAKEIEVEQNRIREEQLEQRLQLLELKRSQENMLLTQGDAQFFSIMGYASVTRKRINTSDAKAIGKVASRICKDHSVNTGTVPDPRYGQVKTYPKEVLDQVFEEYFSEDLDI